MELEDVTLHPRREANLTTAGRLSLNTRVHKYLLAGWNARAAGTGFQRAARAAASQLAASPSKYRARAHGAAAGGFGSALDYVPGPTLLTSISPSLSHRPLPITVISGARVVSYMTSRWPPTNTTRYRLFAQANATARTIIRHTIFLSSTSEIRIATIAIPAGNPCF